MLEKPDTQHSEQPPGIGLTTRLMWMIGLVTAAFVVTGLSGYHAYQHSYIGMSLLLSGTFLFSILALVVLRRASLKPVQALDTAAKRFGQGELDYRVDVDQNDELGQLADSFNQMAVALKRQCHNEIARARELQQSYQSLQKEVSKHQKTAMQREKFLLAIEETDEYVIFTDENGVIEYANPAVCRATGFTKEELLGSKSSILKSDQQDEAFYTNMWETITEGSTFRDVFINRKKDGNLFYEEKTITPMMDGQGKRHYVGTGRDITEQMQTHDRLYHLAHHDMLTGLGNRIMMVDHLEKALKRADRNENMVGVLFLDLDRFKAINDNLGHNVGDELLKEVARRLSKCTREGDMVARLGGDEFVIIADNVKHVTDVTTLVDRVIQSISENVEIKGNDLNVTTSIGITLYPLDNDNVDGLMKHADAAMYRAKEGGRNGHEFYTHDMTKQVNARILLEDQLRKAVQNQDFALHYLPEVDLHTGEVIGLEALLRWYTPDGDVLAPHKFVPVLEDTGLIVNVGEWVLWEACRFLEHLHTCGYDHINMSVNLSIKQFQQADMIKSVSEALQTSPKGHLCLELEITENMLLDNITNAAAILGKLNQLGVSIAIDDFGIGYSSLRTLKSLPIDILKIDRSFVSDLTENPENNAIVNATIALAHSLKLKVVAEGVETERQKSYLALQGCDSAQGYLFTPPLPEEEILEWLSKDDLEEVI